MAALRSSQQLARAASVLVRSGCLAAGVAGCGHNEGLGKGTFSYSCPAPDPTDPGAPSLDAACGPNGESLRSIPEVAVGGAFSLQYSDTTTGAPRPAVPSLAVSSGEGWATTQAGWLGFIAWSGSDVVDFTHVHAEPIASVRLDPPIKAPLSTGGTSHVAATPLDATGTVLGGALTCTFTTSNPTVVSLEGAGRFARLRARASGDSTLSVDCMGVNAQVTIQVVGVEPGGGGG